MENIRKIHLGTDHAGFELKEIIKLHLEKQDYEVVDHGAYEYDNEDDYPEFIAPVAKAISLDQDSRGIIFGGSGQGEAMVANKYPHIRAVVYYGEAVNDDSKESLNIITLSRQHNDSNILSLGARFVSEEDAIEAVDLWLDTAFSGEDRHARRIEQMDYLDY